MTHVQNQQQQQLKKSQSQSNENVIRIALAGNPNSGKTTIFNALTGSNQKVGNYGGVTVETKEGTTWHAGRKIQIIDLPGIYSLTAYSIEEIVARNFIIQEKPDVVVNIIDGSNLERNLYLAVQFKELQVPSVTVLNMADEMRRKGIRVDTEILSREMGSPVILTIGTRQKGIHKLLENAIAVAEKTWQPGSVPPVPYSREIEEAIEYIADPMIDRREILKKQGASRADHLCLATLPQWVALKLLENDHDVLDSLPDSQARVKVMERLKESRNRITAMFNEDPETLIAEYRYGYVHGIARSAIKQGTMSRIDMSDRIDKVLTNRVLGLPIFGAMMYLTFWLVFTLGEYPAGWIENAIRLLSNAIVTQWPTGWNAAIQSVLVDGVIAGVGGVLVFVPYIVLLFTAISLLEDTGYMARAAFITDRIMKWVGLHGKSFIPMLTGFGCTVPAIMATRILENRRDRLTTMMILPLMSCGARVPIYTMIIPAFFPKHEPAVMFSLYVIGIVIAVVGAKLLRSTLFKGEPSPFVMELPPYRIPTLRAILTHVWFRARLYLQKAGTVILAFSLVMWALANYPKPPENSLQTLTPTQTQEAQLQHSITGRIGTTLEPAVKPMGFDWKIATALIGAFPAKELFVAQMGIVYSLGQVDEESEELTAILKANYTPLTGFCVALFCLIAIPCMATVAVTRREAGSWTWAALQLFGLTLIAYIITAGVYQVGYFLGVGT